MDIRTIANPIARMKSLEVESSRAINDLQQIDSAINNLEERLLNCSVLRAKNMAEIEAAGRLADLKWQGSLHVQGRCDKRKVKDFARMKELKIAFKNCKTDK